MLNKQRSRHPRWALKSRWTLRQLTAKSVGRPPAYLFEHEVTVSSASSDVEVVARFLHPYSPQQQRSRRSCGGLVSLTIRNRQQRRRANLKRLGGDCSGQLLIKLKDLGHVSPQSRVLSGNSSPVAAAPLTLSSAATALMPIAPITETTAIIKEDIGAAPVPALPSPAAILPERGCTDIDVSSPCLSNDLPADANAAETTSWLRSRRFQAFESTFASFSATDILRLSRDDLIQICGLADGIRLFNALHAKAPQPRLSLYFAVEAGLWRAVYLDRLTSSALRSKLLAALNLPGERLHSVLMLGPQGIHVLVNNELVANLKDESMFVVETIKEPGTDRYKLLLKPSSH